MSAYFRVREAVRSHPAVMKALYLAQSVRHSNIGAFRKEVIRRSNASTAGRGVAICCRIRDEALNLSEFVDYYLAAGVEHIFFYERLSTDDFRQVLQPYIDSGAVTLLENWHTYPVSPAAEQDCILRCIGKYAWVGFIDADEFVVIGDGKAIPEYLAAFAGYPAVALHWYMFGSNGHKTRPTAPVIDSYIRRESVPNRHVKVFVRPEAVAKCRNSHSWYYRGMKAAVNENHEPVYGSFARPTAETAWINHYHHKSDEEYFAKAMRGSVLDQVGIQFQNRTIARHLETEPERTR
jgi:hypothetical protein